jgi:hypothetical protein
MGDGLSSMVAVAASRKPSESILAVGVMRRF